MTEDARLETFGPAFLSVAEVARKLGISAQSVRRDCSAGLAPSIKLRRGGDWLIPARYIADLLAEAYARVR